MQLDHRAQIIATQQRLPNPPSLDWVCSLLSVVFVNTHNYVDLRQFILSNKAFRIHLPGYRTGVATLNNSLPRIPSLGPAALEDPNTLTLSHGSSPACTPEHQPPHGGGGLGEAYFPSPFPSPQPSPVLRPEDIPSSQPLDEWNLQNVLDAYDDHPGDNDVGDPEEDNEDNDQDWGDLFNWDEDEKINGDNVQQEGETEGFVQPVDNLSSVRWSRDNVLYPIAEVAEEIDDVVVSEDSHSSDDYEAYAEEERKKKNKVLVRKLKAGQVRAQAARQQEYWRSREMKELRAENEEVEKEQRNKGEALSKYRKARAERQGRQCSRVDEVIEHGVHEEDEEDEEDEQDPILIATRTHRHYSDSHRRTFRPGRTAAEPTKPPTSSHTATMAATSDSSAQTLTHTNHATKKQSKSKTLSKSTNSKIKVAASSSTIPSNNTPVNGDVDSDDDANGKSRHKRGKIPEHARQAAFAAISECDEKLEAIAKSIGKDVSVLHKLVGNRRWMPHEANFWNIFQQWLTDPEGGNETYPDDIDGALDAVVFFFWFFATYTFCRTRNCMEETTVAGNEKGSVGGEMGELPISS
jgi:nucleotide-binding universal stress UspA family protein